MGIEPFLVASAIDCVVAQRLARKLCQHCKERQIISADVLRANGIRSQFDMEAYSRPGLPALQLLRLQGPDRPLRGA